MRSCLLVICTLWAAACTSAPGDDNVVGPFEPGGGKADGSAPYGSLSQIGGDGLYFVRAANGVEYSFDLMLGTNPDTTVPIIYLSGIAARQGGSAEDPFLDRLQQAGRTVIKLMLPGQGETLARDIESTGGTSIDAGGDDWILPDEQAQSIIDTLDAFGFQEPVHIAGVSYGGAISAATKNRFPNRIDKVLLMSPHSTPQAQNTGFRDLNYYTWKNGYWDFFGYHPGAKAALQSLFAPPELFAGKEDQWYEALYEIWLGVDEYPTPQVISDMDDVHVLSVPGDTDAPPELLEPAMANNPNGTFTLAVGHDRQHFITGEAPEYAADWLLGKLGQ
ncbi:MAG: alpha/beta fold hydrolase [Kofleriaceae bacterium]